jgi:hypothetical protein
LPRFLAPRPRINTPESFFKRPRANAKLGGYPARDFLAETDPIKADGIAARQLQALRQYQGPREKKLRLSDVKEMFLLMKDHA